MARCVTRFKGSALQPVSCPPIDSPIEIASTLHVSARKVPTNENARISFARAPRTPPVPRAPRPPSSQRLNKVVGVASAVETAALILVTLGSDVASKPSPSCSRGSMIVSDGKLHIEIADVNTVDVGGGADPGDTRDQRRSCYLIR